MRRPSRRASFYLLLCLVVFIAGFTLWSLDILSNFYEEYGHLVQLFTDRKQLRTLVLSYGNRAPLAFVGLQVVQVVLPVIPGEATGFLGGFLFGMLGGFIYSSVGLTIGSLLAFGLARALGLPFVRRMVRSDLYQKLAFLRRPRGIVAVFILFLIPGFPKDTLSYVLGVSPIPLWAFFLVMTLGRMPGTWLLSIQGAKFHAGEESYSWILFVAIGGFLVLMAYLYRTHIMKFVRRYRPGSR